MVLVDWRLCSQFNIVEERWGRVRVGVEWDSDRGRRLERERGLSDDGKAVGAIAASSPMVFFFFFLRCCCACDATIRLLFISRWKGNRAARARMLKPMMYVLGVAIDNSYLVETNKSINQSVNLRKIEMEL
jgi:hypothetical protein